jgi:uncharacterized protein (TIGR03086 family)
VPVTALPSSRPRAVELLEGGVACLVPVLARVGPTDLTRPTPCRGWDLATLLLHLAEGVDTVTTCLPDEFPCEDPGPLRSVADLRERCQRMLAAWARAVDDDPVDLVCDWGGLALPYDVVALVGSLELVVHAWDVARSTGRPSPPADGLAFELLPWTPLLLEQAHAFGPPVPSPPGARPLDRLVAATGRDPRWPGRP